MAKIAAAMLHRLEAALYKRGFRVPEIRRLVQVQIAITLVAAALSLGAAWWVSWPMYFTAGAILATANFLFLAKFVQEAVYEKSGRAITAMLFSFYGRLILTGLVLFVLIVWCQAPVAALVAGLTTVVGTIVIWGGSRVFGQNVKEA